MGEKFRRRGEALKGRKIRPETPQETYPNTTPRRAYLILYARPFSCPTLRPCAFALNQSPRIGSRPPPYTSTPNPDLVQISMRLPSVSDMKNTRCPSLRVPISALSILTPFPLSSSYAASISSTSNAP